MRNNSVLVVLMGFMLCANAWGKALHALEEEENSMEVTRKSPSESEVDDKEANNPCLRRGKVFTIDVRKIAKGFK